MLVCLVGEQAAAQLSGARRLGAGTRSGGRLAEASIRRLSFLDQAGTGSH